MRLGKYLSSLTKPELEEIHKICNFTEDEENMIKFLIKDYTLKKIETEINMSESTVLRKIQEIENKINRAKGDVDVKKDVPIAEKYNLTIDEAAAYFNIGTDRLREITEENKSSLVLMVGSKKLIKKKKMEEYLDRTMVL